MKKLIFIGLLFMMVFVAGCSLDQSAMNESYKSYWFKPSEIINETPSVDDLVVIDYEAPIKHYYRIGSFNLEIFGQTKVNNIPVVQGLDAVMSDYDLIVVQEIRDKAETAFPLFMDTYMPERNYHVSERLGRTSSKEQYGWIWNNNVKVSQFTIYPDEFDDFEREPEMALVNISNYQFVLINNHIKPTDAPAEIELLTTDVVNYAKQFYSVQNIVIVGDLNADCVYYSGNDFKGFTEYIFDNMDTTTGNTDCAYDRIYSTSNFNWSGFVDNYSDDNLPDGLSEALSDHFLVGVQWEK